ncbi:Oidioi.mRNA.OKI2018_I69.chr1.g2698.t1.cds [Oikopleura dioica]|uniref:tRNA (guanine(37)-N1)-methyltransferase n=1 Tax=Oikopleura dioica TaxID=34765 RepID=A0ABN7SRX6_OIKDI|nr:Oidioi.mRNA.OKI2018_I69.chr1.g2698.t1.cds [Oikopleura dioica]
MSEKSKTKSFIEGLPEGFVKKVKGVLDFKPELFTTEITLPVIYFKCKEDIGAILKVVKKMDFGIKRPHFKHIDFPKKQIRLSAKFDKGEHEEQFRKNLDRGIQVEFSEEEFQFTYRNFTASEIFEMIFPEEIQRISGFATIGHIIQVNLKKPHFEYKELIGRILLDKVPTVKTVIAKNDSLTESEENKFRILPFEVIAGKDSLQTEHREHGNRFHLDMGETYWNSRLQEEHKIMSDQIDEKSVCVDLCCGIGPFAIPIAKRGIRTIANDLNPNSIKWLRINVELNFPRKRGVKSQDFISLMNKDGHDVIKEDVLKLIESEGVKKIECLANLPGGATFFLSSFKVLIKILKEKELPFDLTFHCYLFGPKYSSIEERYEAKLKVLKTLEESYEDLQKDAKITIREVRDISVDNLQYCASIRWTSENSLENRTQEPPEKKSRTEL